MFRGSKKLVLGWLREHLLHLDLLVERCIAPFVTEVDRLFFPWLDAEKYRAFPMEQRVALFSYAAFLGTFAPFSRASESPIAIACFRLFTPPPFPPLPERSVPFFLRRMALSTLLPAALPYLGPDFWGGTRTFRIEHGILLFLRV